MMPTNDDKLVTEVVSRISSDAEARKALASALASYDPVGLQRALLSACGFEISMETAARLTSRDRLVSDTQHVFII